MWAPPYILLPLCEIDMNVQYSLYMLKISSTWALHELYVSVLYLFISGTYVCYLCSYIFCLHFLIVTDTIQKYRLLVGITCIVNKQLVDKCNCSNNDLTDFYLWKKDMGSFTRVTSPTFWKQDFWSGLIWNLISNIWGMKVVKKLNDSTKNPNLLFHQRWCRVSWRLHRFTSKCLKSAGVCRHSYTFLKLTAGICRRSHHCKL